MAYLGNTPTTQGFIPAIDFFSGNGATVAFTLSRPVASVAQVQATIENVPQNPGTAFTVSGNTITFDGAPPSGTNNIYVYYTSPITQVIAPSQGTVFPSTLSTGGPYWDTSGNVGIGTSVTSGNKFTVAGSAGSVYIEPTGDVIAFSRNTANYISAKGGASASLVFETGGTTERMRINSSGQVTMPFQPAFFAGASSGTNVTVSAGNYLPFNSLVTSLANANRNGGYNTGTYLYTAPVSGLYQFYVQLYLANGVTTSITWFKNNTQLSFGSDAAMAMYNSTSTSGNNLTMNGSVIVELAAGDSFAAQPRSGTSVTFYNGHSCFYGYLLG
jgi:hypothetical protein